MSRTAYAPSVEFLGAGNLDDYNFEFTIKAATELRVVVSDADGQPLHNLRGDDTTFIDTVTFDAIDGGGTVALLADLPTGYRMILLQAPDEPVQPYEFKNKSDWSLANMFEALNSIIDAVQRLAYRANRAFQLNDLDDPDDFEMMFPLMVADSGLYVNPDGDGFVMGPTATQIAADLAATLAASDDATDAADAAALSESNAATSAHDSAVSAAAALVSQNAAAGSAVAGAASAATAVTQAATATTQAGLAAADRAVCDSDKAACDVDKTACDADKVACDADVVLTHADVVLTHADVVLTHADVVLTHADVISTAASAASAAAAAAGATPAITGTRGAPSDVIAANGVPFASAVYFNYRFIQSSTAGNCDISKDPQIAAGSVIGQQLTLEGCDDTKTVQLDDGTGIKLKGEGSVFLGADDTIRFWWDGLNWVEV